MGLKNKLITCLILYTTTKITIKNFITKNKHANKINDDIYK